MASINYKVAGFSPNVKSDLGVIQRNDFRRDGAYSKDGVTPSRFSYKFDSVDDCAVLATRAINPDGDNSFEFYTPDSFLSEQAIIAQCISTNSSLMEFRLFARTTPDLTITFGGTGTIFFTAAQGLKAGTKYGLTLIGNNIQVFEGGLGGSLVRSATFTRGTAREPTAQTLVGCRGNGVGFFRDFYKGIQRDIKINGVLWQMSERNQNILLPTPTGLGDELITPTVLANPAVKGSHWTFLGDGRWQYVGDGSLNELIFVSAGTQPTSGYVEFEVESISGGTMTCAISSSGNDSSPLFNTAGVKRYYFTKKGNTGDATFGNCFTFKSGSGSISCIIKNISFKPLDTCNPIQLVNTTSDRWQEIIE